jgi:Domain of unknown function (DUF222)
MANEKVSITLDPEIVAEVRQIAGDVDLSVFVNDVLHWQLQNVRLRGYLDLLEEQFGRVPEELRVDRLEGQWLRELAGVDGRSAAGAEQDAEAESTAGWLRARLRAGRPQASRWVRTARALFRGPLTGTGQALAAGVISPAHATVLAAGTEDLPAATAAEAEPVLLEVAHRVDPPGLRKVVTHLHEVADPDAAEAQAQRLHERRGLCGCRRR